MALKDWVKVENNRNELIFKKNNNLLSFEREREQFGHGWIWAGYINKKYIQDFSTKSQALAFAKQYMRTH